MAKYLEITEDDYLTLTSALSYVIDRKGHEIDGPMVEFLTQELNTVTRHMHNERTGDGDQTCVEIDTVLNFIQGDKEGQEDGREGNSKGSGSSEDR